MGATAAKRALSLNSTGKMELKRAFPVAPYTSPVTNRASFDARNTNSGASSTGWPAEGRVRAKLLDRGLRHRRRNEWRPDRTRCHRVHSNAPLHRRLRQSLGEVDDRRLRGGIGQERWTRVIGL